MADDTITFHEVDQSRWRDLARLFDSKGGPKTCWCMIWRATPAEAKHPDGKSRRAAFQARVRDGVPVGILGYWGGDPVGWCSIAPRPTYRRLGGPADFAEEPNAVWSVVCFYVHRDFRGRGITTRLLTAAIGLARAKGAKVVESYPVDPDSPSYRFMGFVEHYRKFGFDEIGTAGKRRHVMRLRLD